MAKFLVIAEKPSVAQSLAKNLSAYQREIGRASCRERG